METFYRSSSKIDTAQFEDSIDLQCIEWIDDNDGNKISNSNETKKKSKKNQEEEDGSSSQDLREYTMKAFGVTKEGQSVCVNIINYKPYFYIKVPSTWTNLKCKLFFQTLRREKAVRHFNTCLINYSVELSQELVGFKNGEKSKFIQLIFNNSDACRYYKTKVRGSHSNFHLPDFKDEELATIRTYESSLDHIIRFYHLRNITPCGWIRVVNSKFKSNKVSWCQIEITADWKDISPLSPAVPGEEQKCAPILQASYDIEVYSHDGSFPSPDVKENVVTQIATCFKRYGDSDFLIKHIITLKQCAEIADPTVVVESYDTEKEVLLAWTRLIRKMDPDIMYQYNGDQFDAYYLYKRSIECKCDQEFLQLGKLKRSPAILKNDSFSSTAFGQTEYKRLIIPGRIHFDILIYLTREFKESSYKLDSIAEKYLGQKKHAVTPQMMFDYFADGHPDKIKVIAEYCVQDTVLPQLLVDKLHILQNQISMANVSLVPFKYLIFKGQQIKAYSQIIQQTSRLGFKVADVEYGNNNKPKAAAGKEEVAGKEKVAGTEEVSFKGATVLPPLIGAYFEPVTTLDFASLYPSIIRSHGLCYTSIVLDDTTYGNIPGVEYEVHEWNDNVTNELPGDPVPKGEGYHRYKFAKIKNTIVPFILSELAKSRSAAKKKMNSEKDPFKKVIYDKLQLAYKLSMNSMYGFLAAHMIPCKPIAATVTTIGRRMIRDTKKYVEDHYDASVVVYGDSVVGDTPVTLRSKVDGSIVVKCIKDLAPVNAWTKYSLPYKSDGVITSRHNKQEVAAIPYEIWSDQGWTDIRRVIRHKTKKRIYRITTMTGIIEVTEDHSLIGEDGQLLKPGDCKIGTRLLHSFPQVK